MVDYYLYEREENMAKSIDLSRIQQYLEWLKTKLYLDSNAKNAKMRIVKRGGKFIDAI